MSDLTSSFFSFHSAGADSIANASGSAVTKTVSSRQPVFNTHVPKRRRTTEKTTRNGYGVKKKDAEAGEEDINSLFWLVEVRALLLGKHHSDRVYFRLWS